MMEVQFYRCVYGGIHWLPFIYWTKDYKEFGWLLWVLTIDTTIYLDEVNYE